MKVVDVSIDKLKPYAMNPRFNDNAVDQVAAVRERDHKEAEQVRGACA